MALEKITRLSWIYDLYLFVQRTSRTASSDEVFKEILTHVVSGFDGKSGSLALTSEDATYLTIVAGIDLPPGVIGKQIPMGSGVLGWVAEKAQALLLNGNIANDSRFPQRAERRESTTPNSAICWPLKIEDKVIGAVSVNRPADQPIFVDTDLEQGTLILNLVSLSLAAIRLQIEQQQRMAELKEINEKLEQAQTQLLQSEKMASIGQLAAGVAHEINNPIGFVYSNLNTLDQYLTTMLDALEKYVAIDTAQIANAETALLLTQLRKKVDIEYLKEDLPALMNESRDGITRVKKIVEDLKYFSRVDSSNEWQCADLHAELDSTISIASNEIKYKAELKKEYGEIPEVECLPSQLNQVFLNMLVNSSHAIENKGTIVVKTKRQDTFVIIEISDTGSGISPENLKKIFDPFFTTKAIGKGTGLGLSLSYGIVKKHNGKIDVSSEIGKGTTFTITLPIRHDSPLQKME